MGKLGDLISLLKAMKRRAPPKRILCPNCGGADISLCDSLSPWLTPSQYVCGDCGYTGPIILEPSEDK